MSAGAPSWPRPRWSLHGDRRLIDDGFALPFGEAMALEAQRRDAYYAQVGRDELARRQQVLFAKGRTDHGADSAMAKA